MNQEHTILKMSIIFYKISFTEDEDGWADYNIEKLKNYSNVKTIQQFTDFQENLPWIAEQAFWNGQKIGEEKYKTEREDLMKYLL